MTDCGDSNSLANPSLQTLQDAGLVERVWMHACFKKLQHWCYWLSWSEPCL